jgi:hypothetical protein
MNGANSDLQEVRQVFGLSPLTTVFPAGIPMVHFAITAGYIGRCSSRGRLSNWIRFDVVERRFIRAGGSSPIQICLTIYQTKARSVPDLQRSDGESPVAN